VNLSNFKINLRKNQSFTGVIPQRAGRKPQNCYVAANYLQVEFQKKGISVVV
jgi:hypothetical protein